MVIEDSVKVILYLILLEISGKNMSNGMNRDSSFLYYLGFFGFIYSIASIIHMIFEVW